MVLGPEHGPGIDVVELTSASGAVLTITLSSGIKARKIAWLLSPAPDAAPESVGDVASSLAPSTLLAPPSSERSFKLVPLPFLYQRGPGSSQRT